jgi:hypothetical protein
VNGSHPSNPFWGENWKKLLGMGALLAGKKIALALISTFPVSPEGLF